MRRERTTQNKAIPDKKQNVILIFAINSNSTFNKLETNLTTTQKERSAENKYSPVQEHFSSIFNPVIDCVRKRFDVAFELHIRVQRCSKQLIWNFDYGGN